MTNLTVNLENLTVEERVTLTRLMTKANEPKQWQPKGGSFYVTAEGLVRESDSTTKCRVFGVERQTLGEAQKAHEAMRIHNRLLAYVNEFEKEVSVSDICYLVYYQSTTSQYHINRHNSCALTVGAVYMSRECAERLAKKLNSGEVVL